MHKIVTTEQMVAIEKDANASGLSYAQMMLNAGESIANEVLKRVEVIKGKRVVILVGSGNNGGDGLVVGDHLAEAGAQVSVYLTKERPEGDPNLEKIRKRDLLIAIWAQDQGARVLDNMLGSSDILIDAILGTGFELPMKGTAKDVLTKVVKALNKRKQKPFIVAVDCPSGLDCDSGKIAEFTLKADLTVTLAAVKKGLLERPGANYVGELEVGDIGLSKKQGELEKIMHEMPDHHSIKSILPERPSDAHKGTFGRVIVVAGSINYPGAAMLAGVAAYRVGAGLVTMAVPSPVQSLIAPNFPEATWLLLPHEMGAISESAAPVLEAELESTQAMLIGPGFGLDPSTKAFLSRIIGSEEHTQRAQIGFIRPESQGQLNDQKLPPCVIDADGLKLLIEIESWDTLLPAETILTPHPGEMEIMTGVAKDEIQADRVGAAKTWSKRWGHIVVLKGANTVIAAPDDRSAVLPFATASLARAGTGDVQAGAIAGFLAQGVSAYEAAIAGSYIHARAGEIAAQFLGNSASVLAGDVADSLAAAMSEIAES
jgi:NAD(P)H-hydrate epimerase